MAGFTYTAGISFNHDGKVENYTFSKTGTGKTEIDETIPVSSTDLAVVGAIDFSALKFLFIIAVGGALTLETNDGTTPDDVIALSDGKPIIWTDDMAPAVPCPLSSDVTSFFVTNGSSSATPQLQIFALMDATP